MQKLIEHCANLIGIDISNPYAIADIAEIENLEAFVFFAKSSFKNTRLDYLNPLQKLVELKKMWVEEQNKGREEQALTKAQALAVKVRDIKTVIKNEITNGKAINYDNIKLSGENYFTSFEIKTLSAIGNIKYVVSLDDAFVLEEAITKQFNNLIYKPSVPQIESNSRTLNLSVKRF